MTFEFIIRILIAAILGSIIGIEREYRAKEAGFRTHFLVSLGSALFMIISQYGFDIDSDSVRNVSLDPSRIASQVVTGIGFIGAGTIIFQKQVVRGLTTAAGLWVTSAIGLTCGSGMFLLAATATVFALISLEMMSTVLRRFESKCISVTFSCKSKQQIVEVISYLKNDGIEIMNYSIERKLQLSEFIYLSTIELKVQRNNYEKQIRTLLDNINDAEIEKIE